MRNEGDSNGDGLWSMGIGLGASVLLVVASIVALSLYLDSQKKAQAT